MHPLATLNNFIDACNNGDLTEAAEAAEAYNAWVQFGGWAVFIGYKNAYVSYLDYEQDRVGLSSTEQYAQHCKIEKWVSTGYFEGALTHDG